MISRCPSCGAPAPDEARICPACGWDFITNKMAAKKSEPPPSPSVGLSLPPAKGGGEAVPATGLGMARLPKVEAPQAAPSAKDESPFALPVARNLGPKPGESLFAPPPTSAEPKLPDAKPKDIAPPAPAPKIEPSVSLEAPPPKKVELPKREPLPAPKPEPEKEEEPSAAMFLPSSTDEIIVEPVRPSKPAPKPAQRDPEPESIFAKPASAEPPKRDSSPPEPAREARETESRPKQSRPTAVYLAATAGAALGLFSLGAIFVMMRSDPQGAAPPTGSSPFGKRASSETTLTPVLDDAAVDAAPAPPPPAAPAPVSPAPIISTDEPAPKSLPAPVVSRPAAPPAPVEARPAAVEAPRRATATFPQPLRLKQVVAKPADKPAAPPRKVAGPQWVFEGTVYDLLSTHGIFGVRLLFIDGDDNEVAAVDTGQGGHYRATMKAGPAEGYSLRIVHDDYSGKHIDELDSTSSVRKADLEQRKFLMQAGARSLPWIGTTGKPVRRDMALVPRAPAE